MTHLPSRLRTILAFGLAAGALILAPVSAQLPADAVDLALVKIPETLGSTDLCPVHLTPSRADGETWAYGGINYRAAEPGSKATFLEKPDTYASSAAKERWIQNFMLAMSTIWCPITDEVTPGGRKQVPGLGYKWESCCSFCDEEMREDNFHDALERLRTRAEESYELTGGLYVSDAASPVEGAIKEDF
jgi:hypothetical protein